MRAVFLLVAAFALAAVAVPVEEVKDVQQNVQPEEKQAVLVAQLTGEVVKEETVPAVEEDAVRMLGNVSLSRNSCPPGWVPYGSRCFVFMSREMSWIDAEKTCVRSKSNLASIHTPEEYDFIQTYVKEKFGQFPRLWIGGIDTVQNSKWLWSDGSKFVYNLWATSQPDNFNGNEGCIEMNFSEYHLWNDLHCENLRPFLCGTRP